METKEKGGLNILNSIQTAQLISSLYRRRKDSQRKGWGWGKSGRLTR